MQLISHWKSGTAITSPIRRIPLERSPLDNLCRLPRLVGASYDALFVVLTHFKNILLLEKLIGLVRRSGAQEDNLQE